MYNLAMYLPTVATLYRWQWELITAAWATAENFPTLGKAFSSRSNFFLRLTWFYRFAPHCQL